MNKKIREKIEFFLKIIIVIVSALGLILNFHLFDNLSGLLYYTTLSNIFVFVFYLNSFNKKRAKSNKYYILRGLMLLSILCTMIIYNVTLTDSDNIYAGHNIVCSIVHIIVPLLVLFECLFLEEKQVLKYKYLIVWAGVIVFYFFIINIYSLLGGVFLQNKKYPYEFLDYTTYGIQNCMIKCLIIFIFYLLLGATIVFIDNKMKARKK